MGGRDVDVVRPGRTAEPTTSDPARPDDHPAPTDDVVPPDRVAPPDLSASEDRPAPPDLGAPRADDVIATLWDQYKTTGAREARDRLILHYSPLVKFVAGRVGVGLPPSVDQADLASYGVFGLIDAIAKFDPDRGVRFERYAVARIRGAIIDELRSYDWVPRSVRAKARAIEQALTELEHELRRTPSEVELAEVLGITEHELAQALSQISLVGLLALDEVLGGDRGEGATVGDTIADRAGDPLERYEDEEMQHILADAINRMPERERLVLTLYYYEAMTLAQIGGILGVTESRVCQIHTKAVIQLRSRMTEPERSGT